MTEMRISYRRFWTVLIVAKHRYNRMSLCKSGIMAKVIFTANASLENRFIFYFVD